MGRTEKSIKNIAFGLGAQAITTIISFATKSLLVKVLGDEVNSLNGLFNEIIMNLSLAELGIGDAIVFNLYKPLAEHNEEKVSELMTFFKKVYTIIAGVLLALGTAVCFFVPALTKDLTFSNGYMRFVFMLFVVNISASYLFSYKIALLNADQNSYVYSFYNSILRIVQAVVMLLVMVITGNYIIYLIGNIIMTVIANYILSRQVDKRYTYLKKRKLAEEDRKTIFSNVKNIFIKELSGKITSSTDNILISVLVSTIMVGKYSFYSAIITIFKQVTEQVEVNVRASMGNLFATGSNDDCKRVLNRLTWGYGAFGVLCCTCLYVCAESFISFWVGTKYLLDNYILIVLTANLFCYIVAKPIYASMHVAGYFTQGRNISIIGSLVNLVVSIVFGYYTGIFGIFLGTFCTYFIQIVLKIYYVYKLKFKESALPYTWMIVRNAILLMVLMLGCRYICSFIHTPFYLLNFVIYGAISAVVTIVVLVFLYRRNEHYIYFLELAKKYIGRFRRK